MSRNLVNVLGLLGAGMVGYQRGQDQKADRERRDEDAEYNRRQRERTEREQARQDEIRTSMAETYAPTTVQAEPPKPETMDNRDVGQPGEQSVGGYTAGGRNVDGYQEGGQRFATQPEADKFAAGYNAPTARTMRMSDVLASKGEVKGAAELRSSARQEKVADMQLSEAESAHVNKLFDQGLEPLQTPDALANYVSNSTIGGELKVKAVPSADGKTFTFLKVNPDGSTAPGSRAYPNSPEGLMQAKVEMSKALPVTQKLDFLFKARSNEADAKLKASQAGYYDKMGDAATVRADKTGSKADHFDEKQWDAAAKVEPSFVSFADDMGGKAVESPELRLVYRSELNRLRSAGQHSPSDASEMARTVTLQLKNAASARVAAAREADPKSKLTELDATRLILKEFEAARKQQPAGQLPGAPQPSAEAPAGAAPAARPAAQATPLDQARARRVAANAALMKFGSRQRQKDPEGFAKAQAELAAATEAENSIKQQETAAADAAYDERARQVYPGTGPANRY